MIKISARAVNSKNRHDIILTTNGNAHSITIPPKPDGFGSSVNGGELLFLALATCYCNDIYREAAKRNIAVRGIEIEVAGDFAETPGSRAANVICKASVEADASEEDIVALMKYTDTVAEIQNTLRAASTISLEIVKAVSSGSH
ncbi:MAG TPA: OsmC family protein [Aggregatilineales bacterium]|nr:OsmC family protein [Aggregatilineales bacterium]